MMNTPEETQEQPQPAEALAEPPQTTPPVEPVVELAPTTKLGHPSPAPRVLRKRTPKPVVSVNERLDLVKENPNIKMQFTPEGVRTAVSTGVKTVVVQGFVKGQKSPATGRPVKFTKTYGNNQNKQPLPPKPNPTQAPPLTVQAVKVPDKPMNLQPTQYQVRGISHPPAGMPVIKRSILSASPVKGIPS